MKIKSRHRIKKYYWLIRHLLLLIIKNNIMYSKIKEILSSVRFWEVVIVVVLLTIGKEVAEVKTIVDAIASILGVSVVIGTADSVAKKVSGK